MNSFWVGFPIPFFDFSYIRLCTTEGKITISMWVSLFVKISSIYKPVEVSPDPALREHITTADLDLESTVLNAKKGIFAKVHVCKGKFVRGSPLSLWIFKLLNSNGSKTNKSSSFHKIYLHLLFQRMSLWSELKVVKAATISIYPTVSEDFAEAGGGLTVPQWSRLSGG